MNRLEFQVLAVERLSDAEALLKAGRYACADYIAGHAVECALKACIARKTNQHDFPPREAPRYYIHDIQKLLESADLALEKHRITLRVHQRHGRSERIECAKVDFANALGRARPDCQIHWL